MASTTIALRQDAYDALKKIKGPKQSFSDLILQIVPKPKPRTCGELLDELERDFEGVPITTVERLEDLRANRGRRSNRRK
jgi:predicted CopG family antitoxin